MFVTNKIWVQETPIDHINDRGLEPPFFLVILQKALTGNTNILNKCINTMKITIY